jgi:hypothetical protein
MRRPFVRAMTRFDFLTDQTFLLSRRDLLNCEMCTSPSISSCSCTDAPKLASRLLFLSQDRRLYFHRSSSRVFGCLRSQADPQFTLSMSIRRLHLIAFLKNFTGMIDLAGPAQIGHVNHSIDAFFQFHERAVCSHIAILPLRGCRWWFFSIYPKVRFQLAQTQ